MQAVKQLAQQAEREREKEKEKTRLQGGGVQAGSLQRGVKGAVTGAVGTPPSRSARVAGKTGTCPLSQLNLYAAN